MANAFQNNAGPNRPVAAASKYLLDTYGISRTVPTLNTVRSKGGGPRFFKAGVHVLYSEQALDDYALALLGEAISSTSEYRAQQQLPAPRPALTREPHAA